MAYGFSYLTYRGERAISERRARHLRRLDRAADAQKTRVFAQREPRFLQDDSFLVPLAVVFVGSPPLSCKI